MIFKNNDLLIFQSPFQDKYSRYLPPKGLKKDCRSGNFRGVRYKNKIFIVINKISGEDFYILDAIRKFFINNILIIIT